MGIDRVRERERERGRAIIIYRGIGDAVLNDIFRLYF